MDNSQRNDDTFPPVPELQKRPSFFIDDGKYYEQSRRTFTFVEGVVRSVDYVQWIEKPLPEWLTKDPKYQ